jgi:hypothetical protein
MSVPPSIAVSHQATVTPIKSKEDSEPKLQEAQTPQLSDYNQIEQLEVFIEKSRAIGLGQRLLWHLDKVNKKMDPQKFSDSKEFTMQPLSVKKVQQPAKQQPEFMYTDKSNTVFYYDKNKVVLLLDFSQSTATHFVGQGKQYFEKMRDALEVVLKNLIFQLNNQHY